MTLMQIYSFGIRVETLMQSGHFRIRGDGFANSAVSLFYRVLGVFASLDEDMQTLELVRFTVFSEDLQA